MSMELRSRKSHLFVSASLESNQGKMCLEKKKMSRSELNKPSPGLNRQLNG